jgi:hypothetical protein
MKGKDPDDEEIQEMDPVLKTWYYFNWLADQNDKYEIVKNLGYLIGSFIDPERVNAILGNSGTQHISTEEEFEESFEIVKQYKNIPVHRPRE